MVRMVYRVHLYTIYHWLCISYLLQKATENRGFNIKDL